MSRVLDLLSVLAIVGGAFFYLAGTVGLLRFPDAYTRLHALTKADNLGLALVVLGLLLVGAVFVHNQWAGLLALPVLAYPFIFMADLGFILYTYGHSIDPQSALGGAIEPFTPPLLGEGLIGQFRTISEFGPGFYFTLAALVVVLAGLWFHRAAYKPIVDARRRAAAMSAASAQLPRLHRP